MRTMADMLMIRGTSGGFMISGCGHTVEVESTPMASAMLMGDGVAARSSQEELPVVEVASTPVNTLMVSACWRK